MAAFLVSNPASGNSRATAYAQPVAACTQSKLEGERIYSLIGAVQNEMLRFDCYANIDPKKWGKRAWTRFEELIKGNTAMTPYDVAEATLAYQERVKIANSLIARL